MRSFLWKSQNNPMTTGHGCLLQVAYPLLTTSMVFAIRGDIGGALSENFHLSAEQLGLIWGPAFWGFTLAIFCLVVFWWTGWG